MHHVLAVNCDSLRAKLTSAPSRSGATAPHPSAAVAPGVTDIDRPKACGPPHVAQPCPQERIIEDATWRAVAERPLPVDPLYRAFADARSAR